MWRFPLCRAYRGCSRDVTATQGHTHPRRTNIFRQTLVSFLFRPVERGRDLRWIYYRVFAKRESRIEWRILNQLVSLPIIGLPCGLKTVPEVLTTEKYIGNTFYNQISFQAEDEACCKPTRHVIRSKNVYFIMWWPILV